MHIKEEEELMYHKHYITRVAREKKGGAPEPETETPQFGGINPPCFS